ncbi:hypothetical protein O181_013566 [Austropuccinia psidii MF-1]|uniref:Uncharacterized protein n=1 Tax=Austropuccinia psidii MF-1 TaxID=1389203 RepID=A0A9Q3BWM4_9BASI|nr:hypothetical protein [Austropuccinia psidii MF-1]
MKSIDTETRFLDDKINNNIEIDLTFNIDQLESSSFQCNGLGHVQEAKNENELPEINEMKIKKQKPNNDKEKEKEEINYAPHITLENRIAPNQITSKINEVTYVETFRRTSPSKSRESPFQYSGRKEKHPPKIPPKKENLFVSVIKNIFSEKNSLLNKQIELSKLKIESQLDLE